MKARLSDVLNLYLNNENIWIQNATDIQQQLNLLLCEVIQ